MFSVPLGPCKLALGLVGVESRQFESGAVDFLFECLQSDKTTLDKSRGYGIFSLVGAINFPIERGPGLWLQGQRIINHPWEWHVLLSMV